MLRFFEQTNYVDILRDTIEENSVVRGYQAQLSRSANFHSSHLSHVLNGRAHLSLEQAVGICEFWKFNELHTDYFVALVNLARAGTDLLRNKVLRDLEHIRNDSKRGVPSQETGTAVILLNEEQSIYYMSSWYVPVIHASLDLENLRTVPALSKRFYLPEGLIQNVLDKLAEFNLAKQEDGVWLATALASLGGDIRPLTKSFHSSTRIRANAKLDHRNDLDYFSTTLMSFTRDQMGEFRSRIQDFVRSVVRESKDMESEEIVLLSVDYFIP